MLTCTCLVSRRVPAVPAAAATAVQPGTVPTVLPGRVRLPRRGRGRGRRRRTVPDRVLGVPVRRAAVPVRLLAVPGRGVPVVRRPAVAVRRRTVLGRSADRLAVLRGAVRIPAPAALVALQPRRRPAVPATVPAAATVPAVAAVPVRVLPELGRRRRRRRSGRQGVFRQRREEMSADHDDCLDLLTARFCPQRRHALRYTILFIYLFCTYVYCHDMK